MDRRDFCRMAFSFPGAIAGATVLPARRLHALASLLPPSVRFLDTANSCAAEFVLDNPMDHPLYFWPETLLNYRIEFETPNDFNQYRLKCVETGEEKPFQVSHSAQTGPNPGGAATLRFISDLPASSRRTFRLERGAAAVPHPAMRSTPDGKTIILDSGPMQIRIPATQPVTDVAPGPILQVRRGGRWVGSSTIRFPRHRVVSVTTDCIEQGPLFQTYRITYAIDGGWKYVATVECMAGIDFVRLYEEMRGVPPEGGGLFEFEWTGCEYTHRQMPNHPYPFPSNVPAGHKYEDYPWEPLALKEMNTHLGVIAGASENGELNIQLGAFQTWPAFTVGNFATFWSDGNGDAASIFVDRAELWNDPDYPIWSPSQRLNVKFAVTAGNLFWRWPLEIGTRSTGVSFYDHEKDKTEMAFMEKFAVPRPDGEPTGDPACYGLFLQNRFGTICLDRVKDWQLTYDGPRPPVIFDKKISKDADDLERTISHSDIVEQLVLTGTRQNGGFGPVPHRKVMDSWISDFNQFYASMTEKQRRRLTALLLMQAYVCAGEDYMPMVPMLSGHPNFLSDVKSAPIGVVFLFPDHPQAEIWAEEWDRYLALNTRYHTRPEVTGWGARGGRWTENLGTYVWGFVRPSLRADFLLRRRDGQGHFTTPQIVQLGDWLVNALSAPFDGETKEFYASLELRDIHLWGVVAPGKGPRRLHPPMGAHAERRKTPRSMWYIGRALQQYAPLTAEHLMWAAHPDDQDQEQLPIWPDAWQIMYREPDNRGTNPHLRTSKYTGYGITMRAAVDTPEELSIHLLQIDDGPNYRWGVPGEGGCGLVYFFAGGKGYSHNGKEDEGDRFVQDTDLGSTFGVWKGGKYVSIGENVLSQPLYDLEIAQQAELVPRSGQHSYSTPEYVNRRVLLAGADYFVLYDRVFNLSVAHRFSWFVQQGDEFPGITMVRGFDGKDPTTFTALETKTTKGRWYDGRGDSMAVITHKKDINVKAEPFGCRVNTQHTQDWVFMDSANIHFEEGGILFEGTSAIVRQSGGAFEVALFHGNRIGAGGVTFSTLDTKLGISAQIASRSLVAGKYFALSDSSVEISGLDEKGAMYIDGAPAKVSRNGDVLTVSLAEGNHDWEFTQGLPKPMAPRILRTEYHAGGATVLGATVAATARYRCEISADNGSSWKEASLSDTPLFTLTGLTNGEKYHARLVALNVQHESMPGHEYPLYITKDVPLPPAGLTSRLQQGAVMLSWGEVLGIEEYRVYKRVKGRRAFAEVYRGLDRTYLDRDPRILPAEMIPDPLPARRAASVMEYCVSAANANGEGAKSRIVDSDPSSWRNWDPKSGEPFRRANVASRFGTPPNDGGGFYYPD